MTRRAFFLLAVWLSALPAAARAETVARSGPERVSLLELYSSEGCSSCPPAEEWVSGLASDPLLWKRFVPAVFHVDYWDDRGWQDVYARASYTDRQKRYVAGWKSDNVYTPCFVLDGEEYPYWQNGKRLRTPSDERPGVLTVEKNAMGTYKIAFEPTRPAASSVFTAHVATLGFGLVSDVKAGENVGRKLRHDFTVLGSAEGLMWPASESRFETEITPKAEGDAKPGGVAVWISEGDSQTPIQAAGSDKT